MFIDLHDVLIWPICLPEVSPTVFDWTRWSQSRPSQCVLHCPWSRSGPGRVGSSWGRSLLAPRKSAAACHEACAPRDWSGELPHWSQCPFENTVQLVWKLTLTAMQTWRFCTDAETEHDLESTVYVDFWLSGLSWTIKLGCDVAPKVWIVGGH